MSSYCFLVQSDRMRSPRLFRCILTVFRRFKSKFRSLQILLFAFGALQRIKYQCKFSARISLRSGSFSSEFGNWFFTNSRNIVIKKKTIRCDSISVCYSYFRSLSTTNVNFKVVVIENSTISPGAKSCIKFATSLAVRRIERLFAITMIIPRNSA